MAKGNRKKIFQTKVLICINPEGERVELPFDISGRNAQERSERDSEYMRWMKDLTLNKGYKYLTSSLRDPK